MTRTLAMLMRYNAWANDLMLGAVAALPAGEATRKRPSLFGNMVHTLNHNYIIGLIWQAHLTGRSHGFTARNTPEAPPLEELRRGQRALDQWYLELAEKMSPGEIDEEVRFVLIGGNPGVMTRGEILLHVVNHTTYHRGFVADLFYQVPARAPLTDLPVFLRECRGAAA